MRKERAGDKLGDTATSRGLVQSVGRVAVLLKLVMHTPAGLTLTELSRRANLPTSTTWRLLATLRTHGLLTLDEASGRYIPGLEFLCFSAPEAWHQLLSVRARPHMERLKDSIGEEVALTTLVGGLNVGISVVESDEPLRVTVRPGRPTPAHATAGGKVLLAYLPNEELDAILRARGLAPITARTHTDEAALRGHLAEVRCAGVALDDGEYIPGVRCLAAPVRDASGRPVAALAVRGPSIRLTNAVLPRIRRELVDTATAISTELGHGETESQPSGLRAVGGRISRLAGD